MPRHRLMIDREREAEVELAVAAWEFERSRPPEEQIVLNPVLLARAAGIEPDPWQAEFLMSQSKRVILNCSRQSGKSTIAAIKAVHGAIYEANTLTLLLSPGLRQSGELFAKCRDIYSAVGKPVTAESESALQMRLSNGSRIVSLPGNAGRIRGFSGARRIIIDEAAWVPDDLYRSVRPMLAVSGGDLITMSTPWGKRGWWHDAWEDASGRGAPLVIDEQGNDLGVGSVEGPPGDRLEELLRWEKYAITAHQCPRITRAFLADEKRQLPIAWYLQEYFCTFSDIAGQLFPTDLVLAAFDADLDVLFPDQLSAITKSNETVTEDVRPMIEVVPFTAQQ